jgi:hypothetical protein
MNYVDIVALIALLQLLVYSRIPSRAASAFSSAFCRSPRCSSRGWPAR